MTSESEGFREALAAAESMQESAQRFLYRHWVLVTEVLKRHSEELATPFLPPRELDRLPEWMHIAEERVSRTEDLELLLRRIERYLGHAPQKIDAQTLEDAKFRVVAKWCRAAAQNDGTNEEIEAWLPSLLAPRNKGKGGRPQGTVKYDGKALLALTLLDLNPDLWSYPKLADSLLGCRRHKLHTADSKCVDNLKKSVRRLCKFLQEIGYQPPGK